MAMLLYMAVLINGQGMATAIVEEKSSRLIEVILGAVTGSEFMAGKILGVLGAGLTQLGVWIAVSLVVLVQGLPALMIGSAATGLDLGSVLNVRLLFYFAIFFSLGYLLYPVLFALVAVTCTSTEELAQSMLVAVLPMVVAMIVAISVITNPSTMQTRVLSLIPFFRPLVMLARVNVLMPPLWEVWLGIGLLLAAFPGHGMDFRQGVSLRAAHDRQASDTPGADSRRQGVTAGCGLTLSEAGPILKSRITPR